MARFRLRDALSATGRRAAGALGAGYIALCWRTTRWTVERPGSVDALVATGEGVVAAFWHSRLIFSPFWAAPGRRAWAMISANRDGDLIAAAVSWFGIGLIRGSSDNPLKPGKSKRARAAGVAAVRAVRAGDIVAIAVDGPRGPAGRAKPGVAALAAAAGAPIAPIAFSTRRGRRLRSWDRFLLPLPFDRGALVFGEPIRPACAPGDAAGVEALRAAVDAALAALTARADALAGRRDG